MKKNSGFTSIELLVVIVSIFLIWGYILNITKLTRCDFDFAKNNKPEIIRTVGVFTGPVGSILGFIDISDEV